MARQAAHPPAAGQVYFYEPPTMQQLETLDVDLACQHFAAAFRNPAEFTLCFTGAFEVSNGPPIWLSLKSLAGPAWCCHCLSQTLGRTVHFTGAFEVNASVAL